MPSQRTILGTGLAILLLIGAASIGLDLKSRSDTVAVDQALEVLKKISDMVREVRSRITFRQPRYSGPVK